MTWKEVLFWYDIYELQVTEEEIISEWGVDEKGNKKNLPRYEIIREEINKRIQERREKRDGQI